MANATQSVSLSGSWNSPALKGTLGSSKLPCPRANLHHEDSVQHSCFKQLPACLESESLLRYWPPLHLPGLASASLQSPAGILHAPGTKPDSDASTQSDHSLLDCLQSEQLGPTLGNCPEAQLVVQVPVLASSSSTVAQPAGKLSPPES